MDRFQQQELFLQTDDSNENKSDFNSFIKHKEYEQPQPNGAKMNKKLLNNSLNLKALKPRTGITEKQTNQRTSPSIEQQSTQHQNSSVVKSRLNQSDYPKLPKMQMSIDIVKYPNSSVKRLGYYNHQVSSKNNNVIC